MPERTYDDLKFENEVRRKTNNELSDKNEMLESTALRILASLERAEAAVTTLRQYAAHGTSCAHYQKPGCICGLDDFLATDYMSSETSQEK